MPKSNALLASLLPFLLLACSSDDNNNPPTNPADASLGDDAGSNPSIDSGFIADATSANGGDAAVLSDGQIIGVVVAANTGEIQQGQLAQTKGSNPGVVNFASTMVADHTSSNAAFMQLEQQTSLTPQASAAQQQLQVSSQAIVASLQPLTGAAFDTAYVQAQVQVHTTVLAMFDQVLIPEAQNASLKTLLQTTRATVAMHLQMAQALQAQLSDGGSAGDASMDAMPD